MAERPSGHQGARLRGVRRGGFITRHASDTLTPFVTTRLVVDPPWWTRVERCSPVNASILSERRRTGRVRYRTGNIAPRKRTAWWRRFPQANKSGYESAAADSTVTSTAVTNASKAGKIVALVAYSGPPLSRKLARFFGSLGFGGKWFRSECPDAIMCPNRCSQETVKRVSASMSSLSLGSTDSIQRCQSRARSKVWTK